MFAVIRHYHFDKKDGVEIDRLIREEFVPLIKKANGFVRQFYPNFELPDPRPASPQARKPVLERALSIGFAPLAERLARGLYGWHLRRRAATWHSRDQVRLEPECLKLHTSSHRASTLAKFDAAMADILAREPATAAVVRR